MRQFSKFILISTLLLNLAGCGQSGELYLPNKPNQKVDPLTMPTTPTYSVPFSGPTN
jgi:predicted small lipoprotein YifL